MLIKESLTSPVFNRSLATVFENDLNQPFEQCKLNLEIEQNH
jgi:hypothetical protein